MNTTPPISHPPHVLIFPLPLQGPIKAMLMLAELLCQDGIRVTFLNTEHDHRRLIRNSDTKLRFSRYPNFHLDTISDGLPEEHPRTLDRISELFDNLRVVTGPLFKQMMTTGSLSASSEKPVTFVIAEGALDLFAIDVADEVGIPLVIFDTLSPCSVWTFLNAQKLIDAGELPFKGEDLDVSIRSVPGMEGFLRRRDLPEFYRAKDLNTDFSMNIVMGEGQIFASRYGLILNTYEELDGPVLSYIKTINPNIYPIGPLHTLLKSRITTDTSKRSSSLWNEDQTCITWLDSQPQKSVLYVSFGSLVMITIEQLMEFWHGIVNSGKRFLWIRRPDSIVGLNYMDLIPKELLEATEERGFIVVDPKISSCEFQKSWGSQEEILAHPAIGGFLTHSGWNSTLESIVEGIPMLCWPSHVDQQVNSRYVSEVWKVGIDMKDTCDRIIIQKNIRVLMDGTYDGFANHAKRLVKLAKKSVSEGGSSVGHLNRLIDDIKSTRHKRANLEQS